MLNVPDLERRWKRYRRSKRIPYIAVGVIGTLTAAGLVYGLFSIQKSALIERLKPTATVTSAANTALRPTENAAAETPSSTNPAAASASAEPQPPVGTSVPVAPSAAVPQPVAKQPTKLTPSMNFMHDFESDVMDYYFEDVPTSAQHKPAKPLPTPAPVAEAPRKKALPSIVPQSSVPPAKEIVLKEPAPKKEAAAQPTVQEHSASGQMLIQRDEDMKDIQDVIARFKKNKNPALSLFVAKRYYKIGNYQQAYNYALITNELDNNIEDSWLIFAKSLYKLDQKDMAVKTLKAYIQESGSVKAKITLDQMEKGTF